MNILKKKLYYKFLDLQRLSRFTGEVGLCDFAISVLNKIKNISDENFDVELYDTKKTIFTEKEKTGKSSNSADFWGRSPLKNMEKLIDMLEDNDDVQNVWHNWNND
mgnify:CR=1 FL=1